MKRTLKSLAVLAALTVSGCGLLAQEDPPMPRGGDFGVPGLVAVSRDAMGNGGCHVAAPIAVSEVAGVRLSRPALMTRGTAEALAIWVHKGAKPAIGKRGGGLVELKVAAHYACRTRNNKRGGKLSEHAKGRAIDISEFLLADGSRITVLDGWNRKGDGKILRAMHASACGPFGTVLGPKADRHHRDHFHFDTASYRSGSYCR